MQTDIDPRDLIGHKAVDRNGDKIGTVDEVYLDDATGQPEWAAIRTGIFGRDAFVPLTTSEFSGEELRVPYDKTLVKDSPDFGVGQHLSPAQELQLYRYYGLDTPADGHPIGGEPGRDAQPDVDFGTTSAAAVAEPLAFHFAVPDSTMTATSTSTSTATEAYLRTLDTPAPAPVHAAEPMPRPVPTAAGPLAPDTDTDTETDTSAPGAPVEFTCREERLDISTEWHVLGTARLRKYVTTEQVERRVPVVRERVRVERVRVGDAERASLTEEEIAEAVEEVTVREERPVVRKYLAPIERVRLVVERFTEEELVRDELRRENVEIHDTTASATPAPSPTNGSMPLAPEGTHSTSLRPMA